MGIVLPTHRIHKYVDRLLLGRAYGEVHKAIDRPYVLLRRKHRRMFHTYPEAFLMGSLASPYPGGGLAGCFHVLVDKKCSEDKAFQKCLKFSAWQDAEWRKELTFWKKLLKRRRR